MKLTQKFKPQYLQRALIDPADVFKNPEEILDYDDLKAEQKIDILKRWEYEARELQVAEEENMPGGGNSDLLDRILAALHKLHDGPDLEHSPPTKQGGV